MNIEIDTLIISLGNMDPRCSIILILWKLKVWTMDDQHMNEINYPYHLNFLLHHFQVLQVNSSYSQGKEVH